MSAKLDRIIKGLKEAIREANRRRTSSLDTPATVTRIDGDTMYVHMDGGTPETPVKRTIDAKAGDVVQVRAKGGQAWATGNQTAPPTDDTKAQEANAKAKSANILANLAKKTADKAGKTATNYLSWSAEYGLIVSEDATEDPEEMTGGSTRITYNSVCQYVGQKRVAKFGEETILGDENGAHTFFDPDTFNVTNEYGAQFFSVDMDGESRRVSFDKKVTSVIGVSATASVTISDSPELDFIEDGVEIVVTIASVGGTYADNAGWGVIKGTAKIEAYTSQSGITFTLTYDGEHTFTVSWNNTVQRTVLLRVRENPIMNTPSFTFGTRLGTKGAFSSTFGEGLTAGDYLWAFGVYNEGNPNNLFEIGYGTAEKPENVFAVDTGGNIMANNHPTMMECGQIAVSNISSHQYADYPVTFSKPFTSAPVVVAGMMSASTGYGVGSVSVSAHSITETGFTARIFNDDTAVRSPYVHWIAMQS